MAFLFSSRGLQGFRTASVSAYNYRNLFFRQNLRHISQHPGKSGVTLEEGRDSVEIKWNNAKNITTPYFWSKYHYIWLRDNCQCPECYHPVTHQRLSDVLNISADLRPTKVKLSENVGPSKSDSSALAVEWEDGHTSVYSLSWLQSHCYDWKGEKPHLENPLNIRVDPTTWGKEISDMPPKVNYDSFMTDDKTFLEWSDKVDQYGFCFIDGIPLEPLYSKQVLNRIGVLRNTMYGDFWDVEMNSKASDELEVGDTAYTGLAIDSHTDGNYFHEAAALQMLHVVDFKGTGGESILVDGFKLAEVIQKEYPDHYHILSKVPLDFHYVDKNNRYLSSFVPFTIDPESEKISQVHFNNYDRSPISASTMRALRKVKPDGSITDIYRAIQTFTETMRQNEYQYRFRLEPGRAVIFDNHRVLHARTSFTMKRRMCGGYVNREDWRNNVMVTRLRENLKAS